MKKKIMIVDDEKDTCKLVKELLQGEGYEVISALSGKEALVKLRKGFVDLVLIDFFMPEMNGRELCLEIRKDAKLKNLKLAFLTIAQYGREGYRAMKKLNVADYIQKPFDNKGLIEKVKKLVGKSRPEPHSQ